VNKPIVNLTIAENEDYTRQLFHTYKSVRFIVNFFFFCDHIHCLRVVVNDFITKDMVNNFHREVYFMLLWIIRHIYLYF